VGRTVHPGPLKLSSFPNSVAALTSQWLSEKLGCNVTSFKAEPLGEGGGLMGLVTRVRLESDTGPETLIAKFPAIAPENRAVAETYDMYGREFRFYTQVAPHVPLRSPRCYHAEFNPANHDFIVLLEDLQGYRAADQVAGCTLEEAHRIIESIASLHRNTWQPDHLPDIRRHDMPYQRDGMIGGFQVGWPVIKRDFAEYLTPAALAAGEVMPAHVNSLLDRIHEGPLVIAHGDLRLDNVFFADDHVALVDFQAVCKAAPEHDVSYFITQSITDDLRNAEDWLAVYHRHLTSEGINYDLEASRERYRLCAMYFYCYAVIIAGTLDTANERGRALAASIIGNSIRSLDELGAFDLIK